MLDDFDLVRIGLPEGICASILLWGRGKLISGKVRIEVLWIKNHAEFKEAREGQCFQDLRKFYDNINYMYL